MRKLRNWFGGILQLKCNAELRATSNRILERPGMQWQGESLNCQVILMRFYKPSVNHMAAAGGHLGGNNDHKQELWVTWLLLSQGDLSQSSLLPAFSVPPPMTKIKRLSSCICFAVFMLFCHSLKYTFWTRRNIFPTQKVAFNFGCFFLCSFWTPTCSHTTRIPWHLHFLSLWRFLCCLP